MLGDRQKLNHSRTEKKQSFNSEVLVPSTIRSCTSNIIPTHLSQVSSTRIKTSNMPTGRNKVMRSQHYTKSFRLLVKSGNGRGRFSSEKNTLIVFSVPMASPENIHAGSIILINTGCIEGIYTYKYIEMNTITTNAKKNHKFKENCMVFAGEEG